MAEQKTFMNLVATRRYVSPWRSLRFLSLTALCAISIQLLRAAEPPALIDRPNANAGPTEVSVEIWFVDINSIDSALQSFTADVAVVLQWKDPRLAHTRGGVAHYALDQIWNPRVVIVNETNSVTRRLPESVEVDAEGTVVYRQRYVGSFTQSLRLESFPFDNQTFRVQLVALSSMLTLIAYRFAVDSQLPRLPYITRLDAFILTSTLLVFFSLIEVLVTTILDKNKQTERAKKIDRYCRVIFPVIFGIASIAIFAKPRD